MLIICGDFKMKLECFIHYILIAASNGVTQYKLLIQIFLTIFWITIVLH